MSGVSRSRGASTRAVHAGLAPGADGAALGPPLVLAAPFHLRGDPDPAGGADARYGYARSGHPTFAALEAAIAELEGGPALVFSSGTAAIAAVVQSRLTSGDVLVYTEDGYPAIRELAAGLAAAGVEIRPVPTDTEAIVAAIGGEGAPATMVFVETPSNPLLAVADIAAVAEAAHAVGAEFVVDNTLATGLGQQPLALGADVSVVSGTKALAGHSDLLLGAVSARDPDRLAAVYRYRTHTGAVPGPFEAWLAHRSIATLELRLARASANAQAIADALRDRADVTAVWHPSASPVAARQMRHFGPVVSFDLSTRERADAFLAATTLVAEATSFGGVHSTAERRARWGMDAIGPGVIRLSCGIEDTADLVADVTSSVSV